MTSHTVALTGATGFIGHCVTRRLLDAGWTVCALTRSAPPVTAPSPPGLKWVRGSLEDRDALARLLEDACAVVHCAGAVRGRTAADFEPANVLGVARLAEAALARAAPPRLLALSSLAAREPGLSAYAASKRQGEVVLESLGARLSWTVLRPPAVYGPGDRELLPLFRLMAKGVAPILGPRQARFSLLYVEDLADAVLSWLTLEECPRGVYTLHDGHENGYSWDEVTATMRSLRGKGVLALPVPAWLLRAAAMGMTGWSRFAGVPPMLTLGKVRELRHPDWVCDNAAWQAVSGWVPRVEFDRGIRLTLAATD